MTLVLYTWATPNGHKPQILLEELGVPYELKPVNIFTGEQFTEDFRRINPNRRIPALVARSCFIWRGNSTGSCPIRLRAVPKQ